MFILSTCLTSLSTYELVVDGIVVVKDNKGERTRELLTLGCIALVGISSSMKDVICCGDVG